MCCEHTFTAPSFYFCGTAGDPVRRLRHRPVTHVGVTAQSLLPVVLVRMRRTPLLVCLLIVGFVHSSETTQQHYVRGKVQRVSESRSVAGGVEDESRSAATPRVSANGNKVVFYSDAHFLASTPPENNDDNDYNIWMADVASSNQPPFPKTSIYNHATMDSKGAAVDANGSAVVFGRSDDKIFLWTPGQAAPRELASSAYDSTGCCDISADGHWVVYRTKSTYDIMLVSTSPGSVAATMVNDVTGSGEKASDPAISGQGEYVTYVSNMPSSAKHEVWVYHRADAARRKVTDVAGATPPACSATTYKAEIFTTLQAYWGADPEYDLTTAGVTAGSSSSCAFLALANLIASTNMIEPLVPSISEDGRFVVFVTDYDASTVARVSDPAAGVGRVTTHNAFMYDRVLGVTVRLTQPPAGSVSGQVACCAAASATYSVGGCSFANRLQGRCCDQKPCRIGALNAEISGDGQKVAFLAEVAYGGTSVNSPDGDLELYLHHIPTDTTHRISHSFDASSDETFPHINHDGTVIVWESKSHYGAPISDSTDSNKDAWMTRITYGCDDPRATNYDPHADIAECCAYPDADISTGSGSVGLKLVLNIDLADALSRKFASADETSCGAWHAAVLADLVCALRVAPNLIQADQTCAALQADVATKTITVSVALKSSAGQPAASLAARLLTALKDARSGVWRGLATRYTLKVLDASDAVLFTRDTADAQYRFVRGDSVRVSNGLGGGNRDSKTPRVSASGQYVVYESESDELDANNPRSDGICERRITLA